MAATSADVVGILASGPSLHDDDIALLRETNVRCIAINDTYRRMPDAWGLFAADACWWQAHPEAEWFAGEKFVSEDQRIPFASFIKPRGPAYGGNSALRAAHMAQLQGAKTILLLGVDLNDDDLTHWFGLHDSEDCPWLINPNVATFERARAAWTAYSRQVDCPQIINCTRRTSLECFSRMPLAEALESLRCPA